MNYKLEEMYDADIYKDEYAVVVKKEFHIYYPQMSDCYKPTSEETGKFEIEVMKWRTDRYGSKVADSLSDSTKTGLIDRKTARMIYKNLRDKNISFATVERFFATI